ncbi:MAG: hypothetical protein HPY66_2356 [Firmicutes bacterium]|nr:hypothetical protein [Bacillota bacterium]MDI6705743.1 calcium/sodium antiporter [Bacillota bacterium]
MYHTLFIIIMFAIGLFLVAKGGDWFVEASVWIARVTGIPELIIGATIVSLATTLPELFVSTIASIEGHPEMALGNAVGSTICNIGLVLGITTFLSPSKITNPRVFVVKGIIMISGLLMLYVLAYDGTIGKPDSFMLLLLLVVFMAFNISAAYYKKSKTRNRSEGYKKPALNEVLVNLLQFGVGIGSIIIGADLLVGYGASLAALLGIPKSIISLTLIALGTSLPELITSVSALIKGHKLMAIGNVIGANILNISMVLGISAQIADIPIELRTKIIDLPTSLLMMLLLVLPSMKRNRTTKVQSAEMLFLYIVYLVVLALVYI